MKVAMETPSNIVTGGYTMEYGDVVGALNSADHLVQAGSRWAPSTISTWRPRPAS